MRLLIGFIAFFAKNSQLTLPLIVLLLHHHAHVALVSGNTEVDVNLMPAAAASVNTLHERNIAALTSDGSDFFNTNHYSPDTMESSDVESVSITNDGDIGRNVSIGNGNHAGKLYNWDDYMGSIDMYSESGDYDYGKCQHELFRNVKKNSLNATLKF